MPNLKARLDRIGMQLEAALAAAPGGQPLPAHERVKIEKHALWLFDQVADGRKVTLSQLAVVCWLFGVARREEGEGLGEFLNRMDSGGLPFLSERTGFDVPDLAASVAGPLGPP